MRKLLGAFVLCGFLAACQESGGVKVKENKADTLFNKVDAAAQAAADSARQEFKEIKKKADSAL